jgi:titin
MKLELRNGSNAVIASSDLSGPSAESLTAHLAAGTYYVDIASHGGYGDVGQYTFNGSIVPDVVVTVADPTGLTANAISATQVNLGWTDNASNETNYLVQRSTDGGATWTNLATLGANATSYADTTVSASTTYAYRVQAYNATISSNYSNLATVNTPALPQVPATPINVAATANSSTQITVTWSDVATETGYRVQRSGDGINWTTVGTVGANVTSFADTGLTPSTIYNYRVVAFNNVGDSAASAAVQAQTQAAPVTNTVPAAPTNLRITGGTSTSLILAWNDNSNNESGFSVERWNGFNWVVLGTVPANTTSVQNIYLFPYSVYYYRIRAYNSAGYSGYSNIAGGRTALFSSLFSSPVQSAPVQSKLAKTSLFSNKTISVF